MKSQEFIDLSDQTFIAIMRLKQKKMDYHSALTCKGELTVESGFIPYSESKKRRIILLANSQCHSAENLFRVLWAARRRLQSVQNTKVNK